ncbi:unnamed protein product [Schistosoma mattheei]|uniref:Uncharacterized protein n=1 Tax=Schistosoma mattheei TaxID=31246 RepID=A0A3P8H0H9_9TREM|nr:unnamed protein product [Schistosoma mattheei]
MDDEQIEVVEKFVYLGSYISTGSGVSDEINARIVKARAAYANLGHLWRFRDVSLAVKGRIYNASKAAKDWLVVVLHDSLALFADSGTGWKKRRGGQCMTWCRGRLWDWLEEAERWSVHDMVSWYERNWLEEAERWSVHDMVSWHERKLQVVLHDSLALFADSGTGWKKRRGGLASVGPSRLPGWGPRDGATQWLETLSASRLPGWGLRDGATQWLETLSDMAFTTPWLGSERWCYTAIIVDESPIKPLLTTVSPLRRLRRANSMLNSLLYIEAQEAANITAQTHSGGGGCLPTLLSNSSSLPFNSDDDNEDNNRLTRESSLQFSQELPIQYKDSCLSVAMSRAERWRRRQLEEEASLSQFSTQMSNIQSNSVHINNDFINENINQSTPPRLLRRNSNLLANMISSSDHHRLNTALSQLIHSPKRIKTPRKRNDVKPVDEVVNLHRLRWLGHVLRIPERRLPRPAMLTSVEDCWEKCTPNAKNNCSQLSTTTTQINTDCLNPAQVTTTPPISTMKPFLQNDVQPMSSLNTVGSFPRSTPRRRTYKSKDTDDSHPITITTTTSRRRTRHSSGFVQSNTRETIVSPQIFDEEAMFLGREEFLNETTPNVSSTFDKCVEDDDDDGAEFGALLMSRKRRKVSPVCTPTQPPVFRLNTLAATTTTACSTSTHQVFTGSPNSGELTGNHTPYSFGSNNFMDDYLINAPKRNINCISDGSVNTVANSNSSDYGTSDTTISTTVNTTSANTISISDQKQSDIINNSKASIFTTCPVVKPIHQSTFAPLHVFNRPSIAVSDSIDNTTTIHSSQSNSTCIALRKQLFGGIDEPSNSISNPKLSEDIHENSENIPPNHLNSPSSSLSSSPSSSKSHIIPLSYDNPNHNNNSRHLWDENSLDIPLSPVLHQLQYNIQSSIDTNYHHSYTYLSKNNHNLFPSKFIVPIIQQSTLHNPSCHRGLHPRRNLFQ